MSSSFSRALSFCLDPQAGYLAAFGYLYPGDVSNDDAWLKPADLAAGTSGMPAR